MKRELTFTPAEDPITTAVEKSHGAPHALELRLREAEARLDEAARRNTAPVTRERKLEKALIRAQRDLEQIKQFAGGLCVSLDPNEDPLSEVEFLAREALKRIARNGVPSANKSKARRG